MKSVPLGTIVQKFNEKFIEFGFNIIEDGHIEYNEEVGYALCHWCVGMAMPDGDDTVKYEKCFRIVLDDKEICNIKFYTNVYHNNKNNDGKDWWSLHHVTYCSVSGRTYDLVGKVKEELIEQMREFMSSSDGKNNQEVAKVTEIKPKTKKKNNKNKKNIKKTEKENAENG